MLFNEPKLLKLVRVDRVADQRRRFSALQRAEIAEIAFTAAATSSRSRGFSALQRAEIAEIMMASSGVCDHHSFSALQRAEIAEMAMITIPRFRWIEFQCSSTSRNC